MNYEIQSFFCVIIIYLYRYALLLYIVHEKTEFNLVLVQNVLQHAAAISVGIRVPRLLRIDRRRLVFHAGNEAVETASDDEVGQ